MFCDIAVRGDIAMFHSFRIWKCVAAAVVVAAGCVSTAAADEKPGAQGSVILTVAGKVANWNRGATVAGRDNLFNQHNIKFEKAMAFDAAMLASLPAQELRLTAEGGDATFAGGTFSGPALADVLKASGADNAKVKLVSIDGSAVDLSSDDLKAHNWMLAIAVDGKPVGIGDFGPLWLLHKPASGAAPSKDDLQHWVWSVFYIEVQ
jgi:hypothetical protein